jgi:hypothetical protein
MTLIMKKEIVRKGLKAYKVVIKPNKQRKRLRYRIPLLTKSMRRNSLILLRLTRMISIMKKKIKT